MGKLLVLSMAISAGLGTLLHGYNSGVISHVITNAHFNNYFNTNSESGIVGAVVSVFAGGAAFGSLASGLLLDRYGRKKTIQVGAVISILGVMLQASAVKLYMMLIGRIVSGFAIGLMSVGVPVYLTEQAMPHSRGFLVGFVQLMVLLGFVISAWVGYAAHNVPNAETNAFTWRFPIAIAAIPAVFIAFSLQWLPESPRYLVRQGMTEQAYRGMMKLYYDGTNRSQIQQIVEDIDIQWKQEASICRHESDWVVMFKVPAWRRRTLDALIPSALTQFTGINIITYYQNTMYKALDVSDQTSLLLNAMYHMVGPVCTFIFMLFIVDKYGRKAPLFVASLLLPLLFIVFAILSSRVEHDQNPTASKGGIAVMFIYNAVFGFSFGPVGWIYLPEMLPLRTRGKATALGAALGNWAMNVVVSQISPLAMQAITWKYYIVYVVLMLGMTAPVVWFFVKEPKGLSLERMEVLWEQAGDDRERPSGATVELGHRKNYTMSSGTSSM